LSEEDGDEITPIRKLIKKHEVVDPIERQNKRVEGGKQGSSYQHGWRVGRD
jgi:hypothetical protein